MEKSKSTGASGRSKGVQRNRRCANLMSYGEINVLQAFEKLPIDVRGRFKSRFWSTKKRFFEISKGLGLLWNPTTPFVSKSYADSKKKSSESDTRGQSYCPSKFKPPTQTLSRQMLVRAQLTGTANGQKYPRRTIQLRRFSRALL